MNKKLSTLACSFVFFLSTYASWESYKEEALKQLPHIPGWCSEDKASCMMDLIHDGNLRICVEVGVFYGASLFPITKAVSFNGEGMVYGIDAWDKEEAVKGIHELDPNYAWWKNLDYINAYEHALHVLRNFNLTSFCTILKQPSQQAASLFADESIDFLHLDGNHNEEVALQDAKNFLPKVKNGGYILLNDAYWTCMRYALAYLLERTDLLTFQPKAKFLLFRKNQATLDKALFLMNP